MFTSSSTVSTNSACARRSRRSLRPTSRSPATYATHPASRCASTARRVAPAKADHEWTVFGFGFCPGLSTDFTHAGDVSHLLSLDIIAGVSGGSSLITISGVADIERGDVHGFQLAGVAAVSD